MTIRAIRALLCAVGFICASSGFTAAQMKGPGGGEPKEGGVHIRAVPEGGAAGLKTVNPERGKISDNESPRPQDRTTVKSRKSNTSDRMGGGGGAKGGGAAISDQASGGVLTKKRN